MSEGLFTFLFICGFILLYCVIVVPIQKSREVRDKVIDKQVGIIKPINRLWSLFTDILSGIFVVVLVIIVVLTVTKCIAG